LGYFLRANGMVQVENRKEKHNAEMQSTLRFADRRETRESGEW
jgi:hypothetical protein